MSAFDIAHTTSYETLIETTTHLSCGLQCFDAVGWAAGSAYGLNKTEWWDAGMVMCLGQGADLHMEQMMSLPVTISCSSKSRLVLPLWFYLSGAGSPMYS